MQQTTCFLLIVLIDEFEQECGRCCFCCLCGCCLQHVRPQVAATWSRERAWHAPLEAGTIFASMVLTFWVVCHFVLAYCYTECSVDLVASAIDRRGEALVSEP
jgi:hypothetical protein